jgi:Fe-S cluster assembly iron-binding protein IscA
MHMLSVTDFAAAAIHHLIERARAPAEAGLRIACDSTASPLRARVAREPEPQDAVVVAAFGARVFLGEVAARLLDDKVLDVVVGVGGQVRFVATVARRPRQRSLYGNRHSPPLW